MLTIQSLYEAKLLSYPRTDCTYSTDEEFDYLVDNLTKGSVAKFCRTRKNRFII